MTIDLSDLLVPELILTDVPAATRKALFQQVAVAAAPVIGVEAKQLVAALSAREKLGSTGFGGGVAVPHAKIAGLPRITAVVARLVQGIAFDAVDDAPVDLVVTLFSPADAGTDHLKALSRVSHRLRDRNFVAKLRGAASRDAIYALFSADETRDAA